MTPAEARAKLLENNFFSIFQDRHIIGGSEYKPGNPGSFHGIRFSITRAQAGVYTARVIYFEGEEKELQPKADIRDLANGQKKDLEWAVNAVLDELWNHLDSSSRGKSPNVSLEAVLEASREHPDATTERQLLTRLLFMSAETEAGYRAALTKQGYRVCDTGEQLSEEALVGAEKILWPPEGSPPIRPSELKAIGAPSKNIVSYGRKREALPTDVPPEDRREILASARDFRWASLSERVAWPTALRPIEPFTQLASPRDMSTVVFMSAARQVLETAPEWLDLVVFSTEPVDGKLTACFLGTKGDVAKAPKPQWLMELGNDAEKEVWVAA